MAWFLEWPDLADWELAEFAARGMSAVVDEHAKAHGKFVVRTRVPFRDENLPLEVRYPSEYPELPPTVFAESGLLSRHQNPFKGNLCLLERPLDDWPAASWSGARLVHERVTALLNDTEAGPAVVAANEAPMAEPFSAYYDYAVGPVVLMPEDLLSPPTTEGTLQLRLFDARRLAFLVEAAGSTRSKHPNTMFATGATVTAKWKRMDAPPPHPDARTLIPWLGEHSPGLLRTPVPKKLAASTHLKVPSAEVVAVVFPEEGPTVGETRDAWLFICIPRGREPLLIHTEMTSPTERSRRIPDLTGLDARRVVVVGAGTLGSHIAVELARAGVGRIDIVDYDRFEVNNAVRHALGTEWSGFPKAHAVAAVCARANPYCAPTPHEIRFGDSDWTEESSLDRLRALVGGTDVVVESTGSHQLQRFVARISESARTPFVSCWLTEGAWGGEIVRIVPGRTRCFGCFAEAYAVGQIARAPAGPTNPIAAQGCSHPTVSGAGFDALEIAARTARLTVQSLSPGGYGDASWNYVAVTMRDDLNPESVPRTLTEGLEVSPECPRCNHDAGSNGTR